MEIEESTLGLLGGGEGGLVKNIAIRSDPMNGRGSIDFLKC